MRIDEILSELAGAKSYNLDRITTLQELQDFMARFGFQCLAGGEFSRVFVNPKIHQVVKVYNDECYDHFIQFCKNHPSPYLPRFKGNSIRLRADARMIRIEPLSDIDPEELRNSGFWTLNRIASLRAMGQEEIGQWDIPEDKEPLLNTLIALYKAKGFCSVDLHSANVMKRGDQLVIIDPYAPDRDGWATTSNPDKTA